MAKGALDQIAALRISRFEQQEAKRNVDNAPKPKLKAPLSTSPRIPAKTKTNAERQSKWREANPEIHRERSRSSMRKLREKKANG
jgi:hypothetical protein